MKKFLQFIAWPSAAGVIFAVILLQYQQIQQLSDRFVEIDLNSAPEQSTRLSIADAVERAAPAVISIHSTIRQQLQLPPEDEIP